METVKFINTTYPNMQLEVYPEQPALFDSGRLRQKAIPGKFIQFKNYQFTTNDAEEIKFLREHPNTTGDGGVICIKEMSSSSLVRDKIVDLTKKHGEAKVFKLLELLDRKTSEKPSKKQKVEEEPDNKEAATALLDTDDLTEE